MDKINVQNEIVQRNCDYGNLVQELCHMADILETSTVGLCEKILVLHTHVEYRLKT